MFKILIATTNPSKLEEARLMLQDDFYVLSLKDFPNIKSVKEIGKTFEENAVLKAKGYFDETNVPCIADDGGLAIDYLDGAPGVNSHRWLGFEASDRKLALGVLEKMEGVLREKRTARLGGVMVFWDGINLIKKENWIEGLIAEKLMDEIKPGFPYRPILIIPQFDKPYSALTREEHEQVNFRRKNLKALKGEILKLTLKTNVLKKRKPPI